ncbi:hypothetical protein [Coleofasciculus chthonoplastes]
MTAYFDTNHISNLPSHAIARTTHIDASLSHQKLGVLSSTRSHNPL